MHRNSPAFVASVTVICLYILVRACVYGIFPVTTLETWFLRDTWMSAPRLAAFCALLFLNRRLPMAGVDMRLRDCPRAAAMGLVPLALWLFFFRAGHGESFTVAMMAVGLFTSLVVGFFEEYAFRGPLFSALSNRFSPSTAIVLSNLFFAAFHVQAQPLSCWMMVFLTGAIYANLRLRGLSLGWLALIHGVTDACFFLFPSINPEPLGAHGVILQAGLLIYAVITFPRSSAIDSPSSKTRKVENAGAR